MPLFSNKIIKNTQLKFCEVVTRDGFQSEPEFIKTQDKINYINKLSQCGFYKIEVSSFTSPKAIPSLKDADDVIKNINRNPNVIYTALVPNMRGAERAVAYSIDEVNLVMSCSNSHNISNLKMSCDESFQQLSCVIKEIRKYDIEVNVSLSTAFGCPIEGNVSVKRVLYLIDSFNRLKIKGITLCDTTGMAYPTQVYNLIKKVITLYPNLELTLHLHNTRGMALANALAGVKAGVTVFDSSMGGLGGCPYAPGATGNVTTEELIYMFKLCGFNIDLNINNLISLSKDLSKLVNHDIPSQLVKSGTIDKLHSIS